MQNSVKNKVEVINQGYILMKVKNLQKIFVIFFRKQKGTQTKLILLCTLYNISIIILSSFLISHEKCTS